ncbi:hypothetical protein [Evansella cellulosilytica]|uniref:Uncharacterized protein n=1 Tax=Evansella cellulosilytica (strain ATCC 21833 / DSM 2522 / FERM P-1141 / JCM 9156 / N-4) TaxID=649639 RepID=E6TWD6_EVAC2|nr:hypothetical protein [Evansella cellulosilytica]ADU31092.1 hypothetical protein Bcell_2839 [Evansella cellulosilytica DSM 2522]
MFTELNEKLKYVKEQRRKKYKWKDHLQRAQFQLQEERQKKSELHRLLQKEQADVERLESFSITNLLYSLSGKKLEKVEKEKQHVVAAQFKYEEAVRTVEDLEKEIVEYEKLIEPLQNSEKLYREIICEKERLIKDTSTVWSDELFALVDEETELQSMLKEYEEAISAGRIVEEGLLEVIDSLNKAKGWSTFDMLGGGMITTAVKHSHINSAKDDMHRVQSQLRHFQDELLDIKNHFHVDLEIGNMLTFADYFFDGLIVDWMVHGKIADSYKQTESTQRQVIEMLNKLDIDYKDIQKRLVNVSNKRMALLENA